MTTFSQDLPPFEINREEFQVVLRQVWEMARNGNALAQFLIVMLNGMADTMTKQTARAEMTTDVLEIHLKLIKGIVDQLGIVKEELNALHTRPSMGTAGTPTLPH